MGQDIEQLGQSAIFVLLFSFFLVLGVLGGLLWLGWWVSQRRGSLSPYTKKPMELGIDIAPSMRNFVNTFLLSHPQPDNPPIDFDTCAICPDTGRLFPDTVRRGEFVRLDWSFLPKRFSGNYVSWGSLSEQEQGALHLMHESLSGYQTERSCTAPEPRQIDGYHAMLSPGPLYVDRSSKILLGWKEVSGTQLEVLIVQRPIYESIDQTL